MFIVLQIFFPIRAVLEIEEYILPITESEVITGQSRTEALMY